MLSVNLIVLVMFVLPLVQWSLETFAMHHLHTYNKLVSESHLANRSLVYIIKSSGPKIEPF